MIKIRTPSSTAGPGTIVTETRVRNTSAPALHRPVPTFDDNLGLGRYWNALWTRRGLVLGLVLVSLLAVSLLTAFSRMKFTATGSLYLGELEGKQNVPGGSSDQFDLFANDQSDVGTELEIVRSRYLINEAIIESGLNVRVSREGWKPLRYWEWRMGRRNPDLLDQDLKELHATVRPVTDVFVPDRQLRIVFTTAKQYDVYEKDQRIGAGALGAPVMLDGLSLTLAPGTGYTPGVGSVYTLNVDNMDAVYGSVVKRLQVSVPKTASTTAQIKVINFEFTDVSPHHSAAFLRALMTRYLGTRQSWKSEAASAAEAFVTGQLETIRRSLDDAEFKLTEYKKNSSVVVLGDETKAMVEQLGKYEQQRIAAQMQVASLKQIQSALKSDGAPLEAYLVGDTQDTVLTGLAASLTKAQQDLIDLKQRFTGDSSQLQGQESQVKMQLGMIRSYVANRLVRAQKELDTLSNMINQYEQKLKTVPRAEQDLAQFSRNQEVYSNMYSFLLQRQQQIAVTKASTVSKNRILDRAFIPYQESEPRLMVREFAAFLMALLLASLGVLLWEHWTDKFHSEMDLRRAIGDVPVYGAVPTMSACKRGGVAAIAKAVTSFAPRSRSAFAESFRLLRTSLYYTGQEKEDNVILITSPNAGDGKTLCTLSLAVALAADGKRVLVVDADLHRPAHHQILDRDKDPGLGQVLTQQLHWTDVVERVEAPGGAFDSIAAGSSPNASELFSTPAASAFLREASASYDYVLVDTAPFPLMSDALIMIPHVDRVLTVLRAGNSGHRSTYEHVSRLSALAGHYGVIINGTSATESYGYHRRTEHAPG